MSYFIIEDDNSKVRNGVGVFLSVLTLFGSFVLFYEYFFEHKYWANRRKLYRRFRNGDGELTYTGHHQIYSHDIHIFQYKLFDETYSIWLYPNGEFTFSNKNDKDLIGLFITKFSVLKFGHKMVIKKLKQSIK